jgi:hypothetical protein
LQLCFVGAYWSSRAGGNPFSFNGLAGEHLDTGGCWRLSRLNVQGSAGQLQLSIGPEPHGSLGRAVTLALPVVNPQSRIECPRSSLAKFCVYRPSLPARADTRRVFPPFLALPRPWPLFTRIHRSLQTPDTPTMCMQFPCTGRTHSRKSLSRPGPNALTWPSIARIGRYLHSPAILKAMRYCCVSDQVGIPISAATTTTPLTRARDILCDADIRAGYRAARSPHLSGGPAGTLNCCLNPSTRLRGTRFASEVEVANGLRVLRTFRRPLRASSSARSFRSFL